MAKKEKTTSFEENLEKIQEIIEAIDSGRLGLEETISQYEEGGKLIRTCREILDKAELKITKLAENSDKEEPFNRPE